MDNAGAVVNNTGCWAATTHCLTETGSTIANAARSAGSFISTCWSNTVQPILAALFTRIASAWNASVEAVRANPTAAFTGVIGFVGGALTILFASWLCCGPRQAPNQTSLLPLDSKNRQS